jgi:hypothetical protein
VSFHNYFSFTRDGFPQMSADLIPLICAENIVDLLSDDWLIVVQRRSFCIHQVVNQPVNKWIGASRDD